MDEFLVHPFILCVAQEDLIMYLEAPLHWYDQQKENKCLVKSFKINYNTSQKNALLFKSLFINVIKL